MSAQTANKDVRIKKDAQHEPIHQIRTKGEKVFSVFNYVILISLALICIIPFWYIVCISLSSNGAVLSGQVRLLPLKRI